MKSRNILILFLILAGLVSCEDFIDLSPVSQANVNTFYKTPADINNAVIAAYKAHKDMYSTNFMSQHVLDEVRSDNTELNQANDAVDVFAKDTGKEWYFWSWDKSYRAIYLCNLVAEKAVVIEDQGLQNRYIGEAYFLRAITYFELVRNFGGVPLVTATYSSLDNESVQVPRVTADEVYAQIISDLKFAEANLPASYTDDSSIGRATKGAAQGMLGKVYLTRGNASEALSVLNSVINSNVYELLPDYATLWLADNGNHKESLFELQYKSGIDGSPMYSTFSSINAVGIPGGSLGYNLATMDLVNAYEDGDLRKDLSLTPDPNGRYYTVKFVDPNMTGGGDADNNFPILRYADVLLLKAEALGESTEAYGLINQVRQRAGLSPIDENTPGTFTEKLIQERRVELAFEMHRWHDLLRSGMAIDVMNKHFEGRDISIGQEDLLMPIPQTALMTNPKLEQNPGY